MRFLVLTYHNANTHDGATFADVGNLTLPSKRAYAARHGYDFLHQDSFDYTKTVPGFERVDMIIENLAHYDWVFYIDADAAITNPAIKLEDIVDDQYDVIVSHDDRVNHRIEVNNGVMLVKNTEWSLNLFRWMHQPVYHGHTWLSQQAIMDVLNRRDDDSKHIKLTPFRLFNSLWHSTTQSFNWQPNDFVLHACGGGNGWRKALFQEVAPKILAGNVDCVRTPQCN